MHDPAPPASAPTADDVLLHQALELLPEAVAIWDAEDRFVLWNSRYVLLAGPDLSPETGETFAAFLRRMVYAGVVSDAKDCEETWIVERLARHAGQQSTHEHRLRDGRWIRTQERRSPDGWSIAICGDITAIKQREDSFRLLFAANPVPMLVADCDTLSIVSVNEAAVSLYGYDRERFLTLTLVDIRPDRDKLEFRRFAAAGHLGHDGGRRLWTHLRHDGTEMTVLPRTRSLVIDGRRVFLSSIEDITERHAAEADARRSRAFLDNVVDLIPASIFVKDMKDDGRYVIYNRWGATTIGRPRDAIVGRTDMEIFAPEEAARFAEQDREIMTGRDLKVYTEETVRRGDGEIRVITTKKLPILADRHGDAAYLLGISEDVTESRRMAVRLDHMAHHDALTGLANRVVLNQWLESLPAEGGAPSALLYIDLDGFKAVNDTLGHRVGDGILASVAGRLRCLARSCDLAVRLGGDEFVLLAQCGRPHDSRTGDVLRLAERLIDVLSEPYMVEGHPISITASVGIAICDAASGGSENWLRNADVALYSAKAAGAGTAMLFSAEMDRRARSRREIAADLRRGIEAGEFEVHYQPFASTRDSTLVGFEALLRWRHPERGLVSPDHFIPLAEELGLILQLGSWVLRQACRDAATWPSHLVVAVNLSSVQFRDNGLLATVSSALSQSGLAPRRLELEITESVLLVDSDRNRATLDSLRLLGARIALDDFGIGHSSLSYLQRFTIDKIKIDRSFVKGLPDDGKSVAILRAVVALASELGIMTTAEGIETPEQMACITRHGCVLAQGFILGRAQSADVVLQMARSIGRDTAAA